MLKDIRDKAAQSLSPYIVKVGNKTLDTLQEKASGTMTNLTELNRKQFMKLTEINRNLSHMVLGGAEGFARNVHNFTHNTLGRVSDLNERIGDMANEQIMEAKETWADVIQHSRNLTSDPLGVVRGVGRAASNFTYGNVDRMMNFTKWDFSNFQLTN